jgi:hypothetical protein
MAAESMLMDANHPPDAPVYIDFVVGVRERVSVAFDLVREHVHQATQRNI